MSLIYRDRVRQTVSPAGTGPVTLLSPINTYDAFQFASLGTNSFPYAIVNTSQFEVGIGTYITPGASATLYGVVNRNIILSNSNLDTNPVNFNNSNGYIFITNAAELSVLVSATPTQNTIKNLKWINSQYSLIDPILNGPSLGMGINSSLMFYDAITTDYQADPNLQFFPGTTPELFINGVVSATAKSFKIPHPLKSNKWLMHGCLEGPEYGMYHRGYILTNYTAKIYLPDYFIALCENYSVIFSSNSFMPIKSNKKNEYIEFKLFLPSLKPVMIDFVIIGRRKDVLFNLEV